VYLIDTNIFIELLLGRKNADVCEKLLHKASLGETKCVVTSFTVHAVEGILSGNLEAIETFLRNLSASLGIDVYTTTLEEELEVSIFADKVGLDFDDGIQYFVAKKVGAEAIISFDRHFDSTDLERVEPGELVN